MGESGSGSGDDEEVEEEPMQNGTTNFDVNMRFDVKANAAKENKENSKEKNNYNNNNYQSLVQNLQQQKQPMELKNMQNLTTGQAESRQQSEEKSIVQEEESELTESGAEASGDENSGVSGSGEEDEGLRSQLVENMVKTFAKAANWKNATKEENEEEEEENETDEESGEEEKDVKPKSEGILNERSKNDYLTTVIRSVDDSESQKSASHRSMNERSTDDRSSNERPTSYIQNSDNTAEIEDAKEVRRTPIILNIKFCN